MSKGHAHAEVDAPAHPEVWGIMADIYEHDYHYRESDVRVNRKIHFSKLF